MAGFSFYDLIFFLNCRIVSPFFIYVMPRENDNVQSDFVAINWSLLGNHSS